MRSAVARTSVAEPSSGGKNKVLLISYHKHTDLHITETLAFMLV